MVSFARVPPRRRRSPDGSDGCASLAFSMPLGLVSGLISGRPGPPFSRAISSRSAATSRRSSAPSSKSFNTKLLSSAGESASMSGGDIPPSSQKTDDSGILPSPHESIRRTYRPTPSQRSPGLLPLLPKSATSPFHPTGSAEGRCATQDDEGQNENLRLVSNPRRRSNLRPPQIRRLDREKTRPQHPPNPHRNPGSDHESPRRIAGSLGVTLAFPFTRRVS